MLLTFEREEIDVNEKLPLQEITKVSKKELETAPISS